MPDRVTSIDRGILVFSIWMSLGALGLAVVLEGFARDEWTISLIGVCVLVAAFVAHIVVNGVFGTGFTRGEATLGIAAYGVLGLLFILGSLSGTMTLADYHSGLILFGVLAVGFVVYLVTRHGLRGAFSQFHIRPAQDTERR